MSRQLILRVAVASFLAVMSAVCAVPSVAGERPGSDDGRGRGIKRDKPEPGRPLGAISGGDDQLYLMDLDSAGDPVTNQFRLLVRGTVTQVKTAVTKTGQRLVVAISKEKENRRLHAVKVDDNYRAVGCYYQLGDTPATAFCIGENKSGALLVYIVDPDGQAHVATLDDEGKPAGQFRPLCKGKVSSVGFGKTKTGQRLLFVISSENGKPHLLKLDDDGRENGNYSPIGKDFTATSLCLGVNDSGGLVLYAVSGGNDNRAHVMSISDDGKPAAAFELLCGGKVAMLKFCRTGSGQGLLFCVSAENGRPHAMRLGADGRDAGGWYPLGEGKARTISLGLTNCGAPLVFAISLDDSGKDDYGVYAIKLSSDGTPVGGFYKLGKGTAVGLSDNFPLAGLATAIGLAYGGVHLYLELRENSRKEEKHQWEKEKHQQEMKNPKANEPKANEPKETKGRREP